MGGQAPPSVSRPRFCSCRRSGGRTTGASRRTPSSRPGPARPSALSACRSGPLRHLERRDGSPISGSYWPFSPSRRSRLPDSRLRPVWIPPARAAGADRRSRRRRGVRGMGRCPRRSPRISQHARRPDRALHPPQPPRAPEPARDSHRAPERRRRRTTRAGGAARRRRRPQLLAQRRDGAWGSSGVQELIPAALRRTRADTHRVARRPRDGRFRRARPRAPLAARRSTRASTAEHARSYS
jgi:hypothetical protein